MSHTNMKEPQIEIIGTRAVSKTDLTPAQAAEILKKNPELTQVDTPSGYYPRPTP